MMGSILKENFAKKHTSHVLQDLRMLDTQEQIRVRDRNRALLKVLFDWSKPPLTQPLK